MSYVGFHVAKTHPGPRQDDGSMMRDPERIDEILNELREVWTANPDLRLGQLIVNVVNPKESSQEVFYVEDEEFRSRLRKLRPALLNSRT